MFMLMVVAGVAVLLLVVLALATFDAFVEEGYSHRFFSMTIFWVIFSAAVLIVLGQFVYESTSAGQGDVLNAYVLFGLGTGIILTLFIVNIVKTNLLVGIVGSGLQFSVFAPLAYMGVYAAMMISFAWLLCMIYPQPVRV